MAYKILSYDPLLKPFEADIKLRMDHYAAMKKRIVKKGNLVSFADGFRYFGLQNHDDGTQTFREWAPGADEIHLYGDFNNWNQTSHPLKKQKNGVFEISIAKEEALKPGQKYKILVTKDGVTKEHIPAYATYVTQDPTNYIWSAEVFEGSAEAFLDDVSPDIHEAPLIYECHIGMATEEYKVGTYKEFEENVLPRIVKDGYNTLQIMAVMEHPYYASFGYQVANFFAPSSRFGTPDELRHLIRTAHQNNMRVLLDIVHSHACDNEREGLNRLDGTDYQYFREGPEGTHPSWGTKLFDYGKPEVVHFLLSNVKYWMECFHFDGFRFDGVTSMLYKNHGENECFDCYEKYFSMNTDLHAITYLMLANELIHEINPQAISIAEDMSGMPGVGLPVQDGGLGFDYRLQMGLPDLWIKYLKEYRDEDWDLWQLWYQVTDKRPNEKVIGYAESHDQALVGDKTIMFRLCDQEMYDGMEKKNHQNAIISRGIALQKMIRLLSFALGGDGYLNFMGNEFGHPEWIDFPRGGNEWSYHYARRQWSLVDNHDLKYENLNNFDEAMLMLEKSGQLLHAKANNLWIQEKDQIMIFEKNHYIFAFNFNPTRSFTGYVVPALDAGEYEIALNSDQSSFAGFDRVDETMLYQSKKINEDCYGFLAYLPSRTAIVFQKKESK